MLRRFAEDPAATAAMRKRPELAEALKVIAANPTQGGSVSEWALARLAGDAAFEQASAAAFAREDLALGYEIRGIIAAGAFHVEEDIALFKKHAPK